MIEIRVQVPSHRETEFYRWFADWRDGVTVGEPAAATSEDASQAKPRDELDAAVSWWRTLTAKERALWGIWLAAAPSMVTAEDIVAGLGLKGARDIPGVLSWSGRKGRRVGFKVDWRFRTDPVSGQPIYGIEDASYAELVRQARDSAEKGN